jgi:hypothetical protein
MTLKLNKLNKFKVVIFIQSRDFPIIDSYHPKQGNIVARGIAGTQNSILVCGRGFG